MILTTPRRGLGVSAFASLAILASGAPASAQDGGASITLEEVVVTARRTEERLLDVPLAITAFTAEQIAARGIRSLSDVAQNTPGLTFSNVQGEFLPVPVIRGFAPIDIRGENNAAIFVDGVFISGREGLNFSQLDIERIEVVKGPQAALYGRNSFSGAINYVTSRPTSEFQGKGTMTVGNDGRRLAQMTFSGPLVGDQLKGRAAVLYDEFDGSYNNQFASLNSGNSKIGGYHYETFQGSLYWTPSDAFEGRLALYVSNDNPYNSAISPVQANCEDRRVRDQVSGPTLGNPPGATGPFPRSSRLLNYCGEFQAVGRNGLTALPQATGEDRDLVRSDLTLTWNLGAGTISSLTGYSKLDQSFFVDGSRNTGENVPFAYIATPTRTVPGLGVVGPVRVFRTGLLQLGGGTQVEELSQELRFTSPKEREFRYSVGAYYYDTKSSGGSDGVVATKPLPADFGSFCLACTNLGPLGFTDFAAGGGDGAFLRWFTSPTGDAIFDRTFVNKVTALSGFAYLEYDFAEQWTARLEGRYTKEDKDNNNIRGNQRLKDSWGLKNWRATIDYKPEPNWTLYGSVAHAEKSGGFSTATVRFQSAPTRDVGYGATFDPEQNEAYELGAKAELFDRRVQLEFDIYYNKWKDIVIPQIETALLNTATNVVENIVTPTAFNANAGDATIKGAEFSLVAAITTDLKANFGYSYIDATYDRARISSFFDFPSYPTGDVAGNSILRQSKSQFSVGLDYTRAISDDRSWFARTDYSFRGKQYADATNQAIIPEMKRLNASIGLQGDKWTLELWGKNLTDEEDPTDAYRDVYFTNALPNAAVSGTTTSPAGFTGGGTFFPWRYSVSYPTLRQYGVTVRYTF